MKTISLFLMVFGILCSSFADERAENQDRKHKASISISIKDGVKNCKELIASHCGDKTFEQCMKLEDPKSGKVGECVSFMVRNRDKVNVEGLRPDFTSLLKDFSSKTQDASKCIETAKVVCGEGAEFKECLATQAGSFPSYCRDLARDRVDKMEAAYKNDPKLNSCTNSLMKKCKLDMGKDDELDKKVVMAGLNKYQACLKETLPKMRECSDLVKVDKKTKPSESVQLIK